MYFSICCSLLWLTSSILWYDLWFSVDAKNQNEPSETKPPIIHNLSHHFSFGKYLQYKLFFFLSWVLWDCSVTEELNLMFLDSSKDVFIENMKQHTLYKKKTELNSIYVEEVKTSLSNAFLQADLALAKDCNKGSFLRFFFWYLVPRLLLPLFLEGIFVSFDQTRLQNH